ncbi:MAG: hypothetical protein ABIO99_04975, partial [Candidatus Limnocylindria bacterium]
TLVTLAGMALLLLAWDAATGGPTRAVSGIEDTMRTAGTWTMVAATVLTVISGWDYVRGALPLLRGQG